MTALGGWVSLARLDLRDKGASNSLARPELFILQVQSAYYKLNFSVPYRHQTGETAEHGFEPT